jgi:hypothetical protein
MVAFKKVVAAVLLACTSGLEVTVYDGPTECDDADRTSTGEIAL